MLIDKINQRLENLHNVLVYCSEVDKRSFGKLYVFTLEERICINQERGGLFSQLAGINGEILPQEIRNYQVPPHIENKINFSLKKVSRII
ncbi:hypothetical protein QWY99_08610 [Flavobacterium branchiarum]|uniref:Uncharacterized protein n=1 Tax=Flavobacterium branchiarum TaxID=1114870 RepID=A0ABV5FPW7_9FLAO|nr:hypothetical protein [Flavobacterium branchiarum]MDN3673107.1 hypothetical protein [Flavobacterium branchiarum]